MLHYLGEETSDKSEPLVSSLQLSQLFLVRPLVKWTIILICSNFAWALSAHFYGFQMMRLALHVRLGCSHLIYAKALRLPVIQQQLEHSGKDHSKEEAGSDKKQSASSSGGRVVSIRQFSL